MLIKKIKLYQTIGYALIAFLSACASEPVDNSQDSIVTDSVTVDSSVTPAAAAAVSTATVYDEDDQAHHLSFDEDTMYCVMASWCPHSRDFLTIVNDKTYNPVTKSHKLVFLFDRNELSRLRKKIIGNKESYGIQNEAQLQQLIDIIAERQQQGKLMFPEVLSEIPDDASYYYFDTDFNYEMAGYPSSYSWSSGKFDINPCLWYASHIPSQHKLIKRMINFYTAEK